MEDCFSKIEVKMEIPVQEDMPVIRKVESDLETNQLVHWEEHDIDQSERGITHIRAYEPIQTQSFQTQVESTNSLQALLEKVKGSLNLLLPRPWFAILSQSSNICVGLPCTSQNASIIQRSLVVEPSGVVHASVHGKEIKPEYVCYHKIGDKIPALSEEKIDSFTKDILHLVDNMRSMEVCRGVTNYQQLWEKLKDSFIDMNPFQESRYNITCRPYGCHMLVPSLKQRRCADCNRAHVRLYDRSRKVPAGSPRTPSNKKPCSFLSSSEKRKRPDRNQTEIKNLKKDNLSLKSNSMPYFLVW